MLYLLYSVYSNQLQLIRKKIIGWLSKTITLAQISAGPELKYCHQFLDICFLPGTVSVSISWKGLSDTHGGNLVAVNTDPHRKSLQLCRSIFGLPGTPREILKCRCPRVACNTAFVEFLFDLDLPLPCRYYELDSDAVIYLFPNFRLSYWYHEDLY